MVIQFLDAEIMENLDKLSSKTLQRLDLNKNCYSRQELIVRADRLQFLPGGYGQETVLTENEQTSGEKHASVY